MTCVKLAQKKCPVTGRRRSKRRKVGQGIRGWTGRTRYPSELILNARTQNVTPHLRFKDAIERAGYQVCLSWLPPEPLPRTKIWRQILYSRGDPRGYFWKWGRGPGKGGQPVNRVLLSRRKLRLNTPTPLAGGFGTCCGGWTC